MKPGVNIDFEVMRLAVKQYAREQALTFGSNLIYIKHGEVIEENPATGQKRVIEALSISKAK